MKTTFNVFFYIKRDANQPSTTLMPIMCRVTVNGEYVTFSTKLRISESQWDAKAHKGSGMSLPIRQLNQRLSDIETGLNNTYYELLRQDNFVTAEKVKNKFLGINQKHHTLLTLFQKHNEDIRKLINISVSKTTYQKYERTKKHLASFIKNK